MREHGFYYLLLIEGGGWRFGVLSPYARAGAGDLGFFLHMPGRGLALWGSFSICQRGGWRFGVLSPYASTGLRLDFIAYFL
jgi:hypothetical protein